MMYTYIFFPPPPPHFLTRGGYLISFSVICSQLERSVLQLPFDPFEILICETSEFVIETAAQIKAGRLRRSVLHFCSTDEHPQSELR